MKLRWMVEYIFTKFAVASSTLAVCSFAKMDILILNYHGKSTCYFHNNKILSTTKIQHQKSVSILHIYDA